MLDMHVECLVTVEEQHFDSYKCCEQKRHVDDIVSKMLLNNK